MPRTLRQIPPWLPCITILLAGVACKSRTVVVAADPTPAVAPPDSGAGNPDADTPGASPEGGVTLDGGETILLCENGPCACNDGMDNDGDGRIDGYDPECTGPFDDKEDSFGTGLPTGGRGKCQDCFFDDNASPADDGCDYNRSCLTGGAPGAKDRCGCEVTATCYSNCRSRTPNGCDCFGCCDVLDTAGKLHTVQLSENCTQADLDDDKRCEPCVRNPECVNPCGECELCPGRGPDQLPASCGGGSSGEEPAFNCDDGRVCDPSRPCLEGFYCLQGCCIPTVF